MAAAGMQELAQLLRLAHTPGPQMTQAVEQLWQGETSAGFGVTLLQLVQSEATDPGLRQAGSIYFKNYLKRRWGVEQGGVPANEQAVIRDAVLPVALRASKTVQVQLFGALEELVEVDFPAAWPQLMPELAKHLLSAEGAVAQGAAMEAMHTVFGRFRTGWRPKSGDAVREIRSCAESVGPAHLQVWRGACQRAILGGLAPELLEQHWLLLRSAVGVFHDLHQQVLPTFFCDNREPYMEGFLALLRLRSDTLATAGPGTLEGLQADICAALSLYACRYEEQFGEHVGPLTKAVWDLLITFGQREENDQLAALAVGFLTAATLTDWPNSPFQDPAALQAICEQIVLPSLQLRPCDVIRFSEDPTEYICIDVEGGHEESRRRSAMDLVSSLRRFHNEAVCKVLVDYAGQLMQQAKSSSEEQEIVCKDACIHLVIAMAGPAKAQKDMNAAIVEQFFNMHVAPELQTEPRPTRGLLRASCLKYVTMLRNVLPAASVLAILPAVVQHILVEAPVVHTYAAVCANVITTAQDPCPDGSRRDRFDRKSLQPLLAPMLQPMLQILADQRGIPQNEHLARALVAILSSLEEGAADVALPSLQLLARVISEVLAPNPSNPECIHGLFDCCALLLKILLPARCAEVEAVLLPVLGQLWERKVDELLPYCFQVLSLLLDLTPAPNVGIYNGLLARILAEDLWRAPGNVPGIVRLLRAFFAKQAMFEATLSSSMHKVFDRFHYALGHKNLGSSAFNLLNVVLRCLPPQMYHQYYQTALTLVFTRLQARSSPDLEREFVVSLSLFVHLQEDPESLPALLSRIRPGLFQEFFKQVWLPSIPKVLLLQRRKVCLLGLAKLMTCSEVRGDPQLLVQCFEPLALLLKWKSAGLISWLSFTLPHLANKRKEEPEVEEYEAAFCRLQHCEPGWQKLNSAVWDLLPEIQDRASGLHIVRGLLSPMRGTLAALPNYPAALDELWQ